MLTDNQKLQLRTMVKEAMTKMDQEFQRVSTSDLVTLDADTLSVEVREQLQQQMFKIGTYRTVWIASIDHLYKEMNREEEDYVTEIELELGLDFTVGKTNKFWWVSTNQADSGDSPAIQFTKAD